MLAFLLACLLVIKEIRLPKFGSDLMIKRLISYIKLLILYVEDASKRYNFPVGKKVFHSWHRFKMCCLKSEVFVELANYILCS